MSSVIRLGYFEEVDEMATLIQFPSAIEGRAQFKWLVPRWNLSRQSGVSSCNSVTCKRLLKQRRSTGIQRVSNLLSIRKLWQVRSFDASRICSPSQVQWQYLLNRLTNLKSLNTQAAALLHCNGHFQVAVHASRTNQQNYRSTAYGSWVKGPCYERKICKQRVPTWIRMLEDPR